jgi:hypothetical protein
MMRKIVSLFQRNYDGDRLVRDEVVPGAEWVPAGEGVATQKFDGTCCLVRGGRLYKRYEVKPGGKPPPGFEPAGDIDENTGKQQGWLPVGGEPDDRWHREAFERMKQSGLHPGFDGEFTCELVGPKVQGNPERMETHVLLPHDSLRPLDDCPRTFAELREWFRGKDIEGVVWHHADGRMVKIKAKDFGLKRQRGTG